MGLKIYWTDLAKIEVKSIYVFLKRKSNTVVAKKIINSITDEVKLLSTHPNLGQVEEALKNSTKEFRYFISGNYKIIYSINLDKNQIEIVDVFDCRQEPLKMKRTK